MEAVHFLSESELLENVPVLEPREGAAPRGILALVEMMLKEPARLQALLRQQSVQHELIPRFLAIALTGFTIYGVAATTVLNLAPFWPSWVPAARWSGASGMSLIVAYDLGLVASLGVCLPSFYFYGLLAGVPITMLQVVTHAIKCTATTAVALIGILPVYVAIALGMMVFDASPAWVARTIALGLTLPFLAGLWGVGTLYAGFVRLLDDLSPERREARRDFVRLLTLAWATCYSVVTPLMIVWIWTSFSA